MLKDITRNRLVGLWFAAVAVIIASLVATGGGSRADDRSPASRAQERVRDRHGRANNARDAGDESELSPNRTFVGEASRAPGCPTRFEVGVRRNRDSRMSVGAHKNGSGRLVG